MKSFHAKASEVQRKWYLVDLQGKTLGRVATEISRILMGKNKAIYTPSVDTGDFVVAINADQIQLTGTKLDDKIYYRHTGAIGGIKSINAKDLIKKDSTAVIMHAVRGMLPKNKLGRQMLSKLKVYSDNQHAHAAQKPEVLEL